MRPYGLISALAAITIGVVVGLIAVRVPVPALLQSGFAVVIAWLLASATSALMNLIRLLTHQSIAAVSLGAREAMLHFVVLLAVGLGLHLLLSLFGFLHPAWTSWRTLLLGITGALVGIKSISIGTAYPAQQD